MNTGKGRRKEQGRIGDTFEGKGEKNGRERARGRGGGNKGRRKMRGQGQEGWDKGRTDGERKGRKGGEKVGERRGGRKGIGRGGEKRKRRARCEILTTMKEYRDRLGRRHEKGKEDERKGRQQ